MQKGQYIVKCINAQINEENAEYYFTKEGDYYYIDDSTKIYKYFSEQEKVMELLNCNQVIYDLRIYDKYIYYASYAQVYRYNMETGEVHCIFNDDAVAYVCIDIYKDYLSGEKATEIASIPRSDDVVFDWCGEYLIVRYKGTYQEKQSLYEIELIEISS